MSRSSDRSFRADLAVLVALASARLLVHVLTNHQYGFHRDELAFLDDARRLSWGYVAYPPLTPFVGRVATELFGLSLAGIRSFGALAQCAVMVLTGLMARDLGGDRRAQVLAAVAAGLAPIGLLSAALFQYVAFDFLWWVLLAYLVTRLAGSDDPRWWIAVGGVIGLGMMTKYTILFLVVGIVVGVVATPLRRHLRSPWLWAGVALSLVVFSPNLMWQWRSGFVSLEFLDHIHARDVRIGRTSGYFVQQLFVSTSTVTVPLWIVGLVRLIRGRPGPRHRALAWMFVVPLVLFAIAAGRFYYLAPAYPMLFAAGAPSVVGFLDGRRRAAARAAWAGIAVALLAAAAIGAVLMLPIAPVGSAGWNLSAEAHDNFREQIGWHELIETLAEIHAGLPPEDRARSAVLAGNYGEAGAVNLLGSARGLPRAISGINSYHALGPGDPPPEVVIVVGFDRDDVDRLFTSCELAGHNTNRYGVDNEESRFHPDLFVCRGPRAPWDELWPHLRSFG